MSGKVSTASGEIFFEIAHDLMCISSDNGFLKSANPRFCEVLGYAPEEIAQEKFINFVHVEDVASSTAALKALAREKSPVRFINRFKTKKGEYRFLEWIALGDQKNEVAYFAAYDRTDEKVKEIKEIQSSRIFSLGELTVGISSLISNLISIVGGNISFLYMQLEKENLDINEIKKNIISIDNANQKLSNIVKGLRSFIRTTENDPITNVQLSQIMTNVLGLCQEKFRIYAVKLKIKIENDISLRCRGTQLAQVFINLLNSSFEAVHTERDAWVELEVIPSEDIIKILITDCRTTEKQTIEEINKLIPKEIINENSAKIYRDLSSKNWKVCVEISKTEKVSMEIL